MSVLAGSVLAGSMLAGCGAVDQRAAQALTGPPASVVPSAAAGRLVAGFPRAVPIPEGTHVTASALQPRGDLLAVSVTGTSALSVARLLAFFRSELLGAGFSATDDSLLPAGASGAAFGRGDGREMLLVAVVDRGRERSFSVGGTLTR